MPPSPRHQPSAPKEDTQINTELRKPGNLKLQQPCTPAAVWPEPCSPPGTPRKDLLGGHPMMKNTGCGAAFQDCREEALNRQSRPGPWPRPVGSGTPRAPQGPSPTPPGWAGVVTPKVRHPEAQQLMHLHSQPQPQQPSTIWESSSLPTQPPEPRVG